ncbi:MAG: Eco57I restriction-modification methylase domain-containing protein [Akkermansia sp.]|nr:Eco57I restriction-modification methylase domain-containing protein [Akkermansia sp.]
MKIGETGLGEVGIEDPLTLIPGCHLLNEAARRRIDQYTRTAGVEYELLYTESALFSKDDGVACCRDKDVHAVLLHSGVSRKTFTSKNRGGQEWFVTDLSTVKRAIRAVKEGRGALTAAEVTTEQSPVVFRPEQRAAIDKTRKRFKHGSRMLWNAKMRFGKTLSALELVKEMGVARTLILTHRPVVDKGWFEDFSKIFYDSQAYQYGSKSNGETFENLERAVIEGRAKYVYFASMQDLRGSETVGGKFNKNDSLFKAEWDLLIVDEAHEGTQTELGRAVTDELTKKDTKVLSLSGTPFNLLEGFKEDEIFTWDYVMEQKAKDEWDYEHLGDPNPYSGLPKLHIFTYQLGRIFSQYADETIAFNFREFFRIEGDGIFKHGGDVQSFLNLLTKTDENSLYPFANEYFRSIFRHTLWMVPGVREAKALSALLKKHSVFQHYEIVNVAGEGDEDEECADALSKVESAIGKNPDETYTITLSCGRLTTGVSVKAWTGVLMLSGSYNTAASAYMQTIFRVQTPATINGRVKEHCYVFDFAPDRTLRVLASVPRVSTKVGKTTENQKAALGEFLNFCPVISISGGKMEKMDVTRMLVQLKKAYVERVVQNGFEDNSLYNDELLKLDDIEIRNFENLKGIIGSTPANSNPGNIDINNQGLTDEQYEEKEMLEKKKRRDRLTEEEEKRLAELKKKKKLRDEAISILRGISVRMPLLIYGADIQNEDKELTIENFTSLVDAQSWKEFMHVGVTKELFNRFRRYYDPEIFSAAGKRIRDMVRAADRLNIEERIARIAAIFATFRNPDKETVLTSWRVVNLHMGDTLGGYSFFNEDYTAEVEEPRFIHRGEITDNVFMRNSHLLEINSKTGLYPLYLAYSLYRARLKECAVPPDSLEGHLSIWDKAIAENICIICKTPMAKAITRRTLTGFRQARVNTHYFEDLTNQIIYRQANFVRRVTDGPKTWGIKTSGALSFNAVVGNPPYQEVVAKKKTDNGQKTSRSIFHHFQTVSEKVGRYTSLIYPGARWIHRSGKGLDKFGMSQINDPHLSLLEFFPKAGEIFANVAIADGISIVLKDMKKIRSGFNYIYVKDAARTHVEARNPGEKLFALNPLDVEIADQLTKIIAKYGCLHESVLSRQLFAIESDFVEKNPELVREYREGDPFNELEEIKLFTNNRSGKAGRGTWYIVNRDVISPEASKYIGEWQVVVSSANAGGQKRSNQIAIIDNHSAFGRSRVALKSFKTEQEARNFLKYATSEVIRYAFLLTDEALSSLAKKVPDLRDYTDDNKIIDYKGDVDAQIYALMGLNEADRQHIRRTLAEMGR